VRGGARIGMIRTCGTIFVASMGNRGVSRGQRANPPDRNGGLRSRMRAHHVTIRAVRSRHPWSLISLSRRTGPQNADALPSLVVLFTSATYMVPSFHHARSKGGRPAQTLDRELPRQIRHLSGERVKAKALSSPGLGAHLPAMPALQLQLRRAGSERSSKEKLSFVVRQASGLG